MGVDCELPLVRSILKITFIVVSVTLTLLVQFLRLFLSYLDYSLKQEFYLFSELPLTTLIRVIIHFLNLNINISTTILWWHWVIPVSAKCMKTVTYCLRKKSLFSFSYCYRFSFPSLTAGICVIYTLKEAPLFAKTLPVGVLHRHGLNGWRNWGNYLDKLERIWSLKKFFWEPVPAWFNAKCQE